MALQDEEHSAQMVEDLACGFAALFDEVALLNRRKEDLEQQLQALQSQVRRSDVLCGPLYLSKKKKNSSRSVAVHQVPR